MAAYQPDLRSTLEAQIIDLADEIAYNNHDIDDGLKAGYLERESLMQVELWAETDRLVTQKYPGLAGERARKRCTRDAPRAAFDHPCERSIHQVGDLR